MHPISRVTGAVAAGLPGRALRAPMREFMERRFDADFRSVRLHDGPHANALSSALGADACAIGPHVLFAEPFHDDVELLAHELTHVVQYQRFRNAGSGSVAVAPLVVPADCYEEREARHVASRIVAGHDAGPITGRLGAIARNATSKAIEKLISYSATDWEVTTAEERQVLVLLAGDTSPINTINDLKTAGMLEALIDRVDTRAERLELMQVLGAKLDDATVDALWSATLMLGEDLPYLPGFLLRVSHELQSKLRKIGMVLTPPVFNSAAYAYVVGKTSTAPFGGSGATGINPTTRPEISRTDRAGMAVGIESIRRLYHNPLGDLGTYLGSLTPRERTDQATLLLKQPISSVVPHSYLGKIPSRADVIRAVGSLYNLHGAAIAAFILAEQRDQSANEDAKDYQSAVSILSYNSSIGLGQVVVSTARRNNLFGDVLSPKTIGGVYGTGMAPYEIAMLLASDDFNIFAAAKYLRKTANDGASMTAARLPNTAARWPGVDFGKYAQNSRFWPDANIAALGSEYTSAPWDDRLSAWGDFVLEAYRDVVAAGIF